MQRWTKTLVRALEGADYPDKRPCVPAALAQRSNWLASGSGPHTRPYSLLINEGCVTQNWPQTELFIFISQTYLSVEQFGPIRLLLLFHTFKGCEDVSLTFPF